METPVERTILSRWMNSADCLMQVSLAASPRRCCRILAEAGKECIYRLPSLSRLRALLQLIHGIAIHVRSWLAPSGCAVGGG
jgi:hypothetical protein